MRLHSRYTSRGHELEYDVDYRLEGGRARDPSAPKLSAAEQEPPKSVLHEVLSFLFSELDILPSRKSEGSDTQSTMTSADESLAADCTRVGSSAKLKGAVFNSELLSEVREPPHMADSYLV